eukprot:m.6967 g.6967  ORF g.6967 m.6967 type:complete len:270 (+) comp17365_c0_seq1:297-1106(+)
MISLLAERLYQQRLDDGPETSPKTGEACERFRIVVPSTASRNSIAGRVEVETNSLARKRKRSNSIPGAFGLVKTNWNPGPTSVWSPVKRTKTMTPPARFSSSFLRYRHTGGLHSTSSLDSEASDDGFFSATSLFSINASTSASEWSPEKSNFSLGPRMDLLRSTSQPCVARPDTGERSPIRPLSGGTAKKRHRERPHLNFAKMSQSRSYESLGFEPRMEAEIDFWPPPASAGSPVPMGFGQTSANEDARCPRFFEDMEDELDISKIEEN